MIKNNKTVEKVGKAEREKALDDMNKELTEVYSKVQKLFNDDAANTIKNRYILGKIVLDVYNNEEKIYGARSIERLATALGRNPTLLYDAMKFVETYDEKELDEIVNARNRNGQPLLWSHIEALIHVPSEKLRKTMFETALVENLTPSELANRIHEFFGGTRSNSNGRKLAKPSDFNGYLDSIISTSDVVVKKAQTVWLGGDKTIVDAAKTISSVDKATLDKIDKALDRLTETEVAVKETCQELVNLRQKLEKGKVEEEMCDPSLYIVDDEEYEEHMKSKKKKK